MGTTGQSITLANSIIGVGILAMPFCFQQCGVLLATLILITMGLVSRLCCYFLLKSALIARRRNFEFLAFHVFGSAGKLAVELGIIGFLMGTCIAYFVVVGELGPQIVSKMFNINQSDILRTSIMVIVSVVCVLPLGLLRNVDSLSNVSAATIGFYICLVVKVTAEAAAQVGAGGGAGVGAGGGAWRRQLQLWRPAGLLQCVPIFSMALFCQTQLFEIFESLPSLSLEKMNVVTKNAINICTCVYFTLGVFGYIAFCSHQISGNILMSLSPTMASDVIKLGFVMSLAFSFPLIIFPCRASLYSFLYKRVHSSQHDNIINHSIPETTFRCITVGIVAAALFVSLLIPDIELVLGLVGSTIGVLICVVFPTACFVNVTFKNTNERLLAKAVLVLGVIIMVLGTYANLQAAENTLDKYDERYITQERIDKIVEDFFEKRGVNGEEPYMKQLPKSDKLDERKPSNTVIKDSEVQPPNPVPPESDSNEIKSRDSKKNIHIDKIKNNKLLNDVLLPEKVKEEQAADKASDSHPKNLKGKLEVAKLANGDKIAEKSPDAKNEEIKDEKVKLMKQQKLIETMKQHGEEQKELMQEQKEIMAEIIKNKNEEKSKEIEPSPELPNDVKPSKEPKDDVKHLAKEHEREQKDILNEIIRTRKEFQENKKVNSDEAKDIAVESIKQIASMAIKSIGVVTDKPAPQDNEHEKAERLEKLKNEAVQEIAKKAVETIEAIKEIKQNPEDTDNKPNLIPEDLKRKEVKSHKVQVQNPSPQQIVQYVNKPSQDNETMVHPKDKMPQTKETVIQQKENSENTKVEKTPEKKHSHSPDEPKSYKEGEDAQDNSESKLNQNIPIPLALNSFKKPEDVGNIANKNSPQHIPRQKREVVDCTKTVTLDPVDRNICKNVLSPKFDKSDESLPKVDVNDVMPPKPVAHIARSLKSVSDAETA